MGILFSYRKKDDNYEEILLQLDNSIYKTEINISEARLRQRKVTALLTFYSILLYLFWLLSFFFITWPSITFTDGIVEPLMKISPLILVPIFIRWIVHYYYWRYLNYQEQELDSLKKKQKQKVEEMKQKMKYYVAKNLIERYENGTPRRKSAVDAAFKEKELSSSGGNKLTLPIASQPSHPSFRSSPNTPVLGDNKPTQFQPLPAHMSNAHQMTQYQRTWVDRIVDLIIGEEPNANSKYALICEKCLNHNGLVLPEEFAKIKYTCPKCGHFNGRGNGMTPVLNFSADKSEPKSPLSDYSKSPTIEKAEDLKKKLFQDDATASSFQPFETDVKQRKSKNENESNKDE